MIDFYIKEAEAADINPILEIEKEIFISFWTSEQLKIELETGSFFLKAVEKANHSIVAYLIARLLKPEAELLRIGVKKSFQNMKVGYQLHQFFLNYLKENSYRQVFLEVRASNTIAIDFYKKAGYSCSGLRKNYYSRPTEDALLFALKID